MESSWSCLSLHGRPGSRRRAEPALNGQGGSGVRFGGEIPRPSKEQTWLNSAQSIRGPRTSPTPVGRDTAKLAPPGPRNPGPGAGFSGIDAGVEVVAADHAGARHDGPGAAAHV